MDNSETTINKLIQEVCALKNAASPDTDEESPWNNSDGSAADQTSGNINYVEGLVGVGVDPQYGLHVGQTRDFAKTFTTTGGSSASTAYILRSNDGVGNFHQYWNTEGTGTPVRLDTGSALNEEFSANSEWYQVRGDGIDVAGSTIAWNDIHWMNMETGEHRFNQYGDGNFVGSSTYTLGVNANGEVVEIPNATTPTLNVTKEMITTVYADGAIQADGTNVISNNSNVVRIASGQYQITFDTPLPTTDYTLSLTPSDDPNRDQKKIAYGNRTANGFTVYTTVDDNGGTADPLDDISFHYQVFAEKEVITDVTII